MLAAQPRAESRLQDLLDSELRALAPEFTVAVAEQVRTALEQHERPTQASIARQLGIGQRTLQRRLHEEGSKDTVTIVLGSDPRGADEGFTRFVASVGGSFSCRPG